MGEQARQEGLAGGAFDKLRRTRQQTQHQVQHHRARDVPGRDVRQQLRPARQRHAVRPPLVIAGMEIVQPVRMPQFLPQQALQILRRQLLEKIVQPRRQNRRRKTRFRRPGGQDMLAEGIIRFQPVAPDRVQTADDALGRAPFQITGAVAFQRLAGLGDQSGSQRRIGRQVGQEISRQFQRFVTHNSGCVLMCCSVEPVARNRRAAPTLQ